MSIRQTDGNSAQRALRGHIDAVHVGYGFLHVCGWVCGIDGTAAEPPMTISVNGHAFGGYKLSQRDDLLLAGIADGMAAIDVVLPLAGHRVDADCNVTITDATGKFCELACSADRHGLFLPQGALEAVGGGYISGWIFDPGATSERPPHLLMEDEFVAALVPTTDRFDLPFDFGDGQRRFGFQVTIEAVRRKLLRRKDSINGTTAMLALVSSGYMIATAKIRMVDEDLVLLAKSCALPPMRICSSDILDQLLALN